MNHFLKAFCEAHGLTDETDYAWIVTKDHLNEPGDDRTEVGTYGPRDAREGLVTRLREGEGHRFTLYDDDGIRYFSGYVLTEYHDTDADMDERHCLAPLEDLGEAYGCTSVRYANRPEWDI